MRFKLDHALLLAAVCLAASGAHAQQPARVCVTDAAGKPLPGVRAVPSNGSAVAVTGGDGCVNLAGAVGPVQLRLEGFTTRVVTASYGAATMRVVLSPQTVQQQVTVTADRGLAGVTDSAASVAVLNPEQLAAEPGLTLDDSLHQVAGFKLFRRSSSWTANPTSEGISLRGLGSTAASRTAIVSDQVPMNDPFGGWVHWNEIPTLALAQVSLLRGGAADLYGSSAIGGAIDLQPVLPPAPHDVRMDLDAFGAQEDTAIADMLITAAGRRSSILAAGSGLKTDGYIVTAPSQRGPVDAPSNVSSETGRVEVREAPSAASSVFLRGNVLNELRSNGTPLTPNAARLWRYQGGGDLDSRYAHGSLRVFGSRETYRQQFSSVNATRTAETLTKLQRVPSDEFGYSLLASRVFPHAITAAIGTDLRDIRGTDDETSPATRVTTSTSAHQREVGGYIDGIWQPRGWSVSASIRVDSFNTFDARQILSSGPAVTALPQISELVASPRVGLVKHLPGGLALTAEGFRAFRGPTLNELYRTSQIGQQVTNANPSLLAERATGFEVGGEFGSLRARGRELGRLRAVYFWTEVNRPVSTVQTAGTATAQTLQRQNLGQLRSDGMMIEAQSARLHGFDATFGYQLAFATVTKFNTSSPLQANLVGKWLPEVPRESITATLNYGAPRVANFHLIGSYTGQEYDDSNNTQLYLLHPFARFDISADRPLGHGVSLSAGALNVLNRSIDAERTPLLQLAPPRVVQGGVRYAFGR